MAATLVEQTYNQLLEMIIRKELKPGDKLPAEMALCERFDVSRNTVRAALNKLEALGFTSSRQGDGTYINKVDGQVYLNFFVPALLTHNPDLLEIMQFRKGIEVESARLAAQYADPEDERELNDILERCKENRQHLVELAAAHNEFHSAVAKASHNKMFKAMMDIINVMLLPELQNFLHAQGKDVDSAFYHEMVLMCILNRKPDEAAFFMERHLSLVIERVKEYISNP